MSKEIKYILFTFISCTVVVYFYSVYSGYYSNRAFFQVTPVGLSSWRLFLTLLYSILPFAVLYVLYKWTKRTTSTRKTSIPIKLFGWFLLLLIGFQIITSVIFGVGVVQTNYEASGFMKLLIQITYRINPVFGVFIYGSLVGSKNKTQFVLWVMVIALFLFRHYLGGLVFFGFYLVFKYHAEIIYFIKKRWHISAVILLLMPICVSTLYGIREQLRDKNQTTEFSIHTKSFLETICVSLAGRMSSFNELGFMQEREVEVQQLARKHCSTYQYTKEALIPFYGRIIPQLEKKMTYSDILPVVHAGEGIFKKSAGHNGPVGVLLIGSYLSFGTACVNLLTMLLIVVVTFLLSNFIRHEKIKEILFLFFCFAAMSGVAQEFGGILLSTILYFTIFLFLNMFCKKKMA